MYEGREEVLRKKNRTPLKNVSKMKDFYGGVPPPLLRNKGFHPAEEGQKGFFIPKGGCPAEGLPLEGGVNQSGTPLRTEGLQLEGGLVSAEPPWDIAKIPMYLKRSR